MILVSGVQHSESVFGAMVNDHPRKSNIQPHTQLWNLIFLQGQLLRFILLAAITYIVLYCYLWPPCCTWHPLMDFIMGSLYFFDSHHPFHPLSTSTSDNSQSVLKELFLALQDIVCDPSQILNDWKLLLFLLWWRCTFLSNYQMLCTGSLGWGGNRALWHSISWSEDRGEESQHRW